MTRDSCKAADVRESMRRGGGTIPLPKQTDYDLPFIAMRNIRDLEVRELLQFLSPGHNFIKSAMRKENKVSSDLSSSGTGKSSPLKINGDSTTSRTIM